MQSPAELVDTDSKLYNQIDGGAPKYIDHGWVKSVYATYQEETRTTNVAVHDMGTADNAQNLFQFDLPISRLPINNLPDGRVTAVVDMGLPTAYAGEGYVGQYVVQVAIDERSDAALADVKDFLLTTLGHLR